MNIKPIATLAAALIASSVWAGGPADAKCGAGSCSKKEKVASPKAEGGKEASCSKKEGAKDASCSKKEASCSKKDASCSKK